MFVHLPEKIKVNMIGTNTVSVPKKGFSHGYPAAPRWKYVLENANSREQCTTAA